MPGTRSRPADRFHAATFERLAPLVQERVEVLSEVPGYVDFVFLADPVVDDDSWAKAMAKNPGERYGTAQELADDLRRFLEDKPILAKPPTLLDRAAKWSRCKCRKISCRARNRARKIIHSGGENG